MKLNDISQFYGVPVTVQLRAPYVVVQPVGKGLAPHAQDPSVQHWVMDQALAAGPDQKAVPAMLQMLFGVVMQKVSATGAPDDRAWVMLALPISDQTVLEVLLPVEAIFAVSRIAAHSEPSRLVKP